MTRSSSLPKHETRGLTTARSLSQSIASCLVTIAACVFAAFAVGVIVAAQYLAQIPPRSFVARKGGRDQIAAARRCSVLAMILAVAIVGAGCRTISYSDATGRTFSHSNFAFDTKVGRISVRKTADGEEVTIENLDSQSQALQLAREAIQAVRP